VTYPTKLEMESRKRTEFLSAGLVPSRNSCKLENAVMIKIAGGGLTQIAKVGQFPRIRQAVPIAVEPEHGGGTGDAPGTVDENDGVLAFVGGGDI